MTDAPLGRISTRQDGPTGYLIIDNERRRNALSLAMWQAIPGAIRSFEDDPDIRVIVLTGAGDKAFAAGADISQFEQRRSTADQAEIYGEAVHTAGAAIAGARKPTIAMIRGFCYGGGAGVALSCDIRIGADDARIAISAAKLGIGYPYDGLKRLVDLAGPAIAKEMMFTAEPLGADRALAAGLLNQVVPADALASHVARMAAAMAANAPLSIASAKLGIDTVLMRPGEQDFAACRRLVDACMSSADYEEGRRAFVEKRKPVFKGI